MNDIKQRWNNEKRIETESLLSLFQNQWLVIYQTSTTLLSKELSECLYTINVVDGAASLATAVHGKDTIAHVHTTQRNRRGKNITQCAATSHITMVDKALTWYASLAAYLSKDSSRNGITGIFLCRIELYHRSTAQHRMIGWVVFLAIVRMPCVSIISRHHEGTLHSLIESFFSAALCQGYALQD